MKKSNLSRLVLVAIAQLTLSLNALALTDESQDKSISLTKVASCKTITEVRATDNRYALAEAKLDLVEFDGMIFIKAIESKSGVAVEVTGGSSDAKWYKRYLVGEWFMFKTDATGHVFPDKSNEHGFGGDDKSVYFNYSDDGNVVEAKAKFGSGVTMFVGPHWDILTIKYDKVSKLLNVKIAGGLWGLQSKTWSDFSMQCE